MALSGCMPQAVGGGKCIFAFISNSFGSDERASLLARSWREQTSILSHHHRRAALAFVAGPLLLTTHDRRNGDDPGEDEHGYWGATEQQTGLRAYGKGITTHNSPCRGRFGQSPDGAGVTPEAARMTAWMG
jgi:hypothetical protein